MQITPVRTIHRVILDFVIEPLSKRRKDKGRNPLPQCELPYSRFPRGPVFRAFVLRPLLGSGMLFAACPVPTLLPAIGLSPIWLGFRSAFRRLGGDPLREDAKTGQPHFGERDCPSAGISLEGVRRPRMPLTCFGSKPVAVCSAAGFAFLGIGTFGTLRKPLCAPAPDSIAVVRVSARAHLIKLQST
jgi:hypothetical protein